MSISRRTFLAASATTLALPALGAFRPRRADTFYLWTEVAPGLWAGQVRTGDNMAVLGGNSLLAVDKDGSLLIDTMQTVLGPALRREALGKTGTITHVLNTHHHFDHAGGNAVFTPDCTVIGHSKCRERLMDGKTMVAQFDQKIAAIEGLGIDGATAAAADARAFKSSLADLKPDAFACTKTQDTDKALDLAGRKVNVYHVGPGHTDNDLFVYFPKENVLVTGDLVFNGYHAFYDASAKPTSVGWQTSLRRAHELCDAKTVVVPGHGEVADRAAITRQIEYFDKARDFVAAAMKAGETRDEVAAMTLPGYEAYKLKVAQGYLMGGLFDELSQK